MCTYAVSDVLEHLVVEETASVGGTDGEVHVQASEHALGVGDVGNEGGSTGSTNGTVWRVTTTVGVEVAASAVK